MSFFHWSQYLISDGFIKLLGCKPRTLLLHLLYSRSWLYFVFKNNMYISNSMCTCTPMSIKQGRACIEISGLHTTGVTFSNLGTKLQSSG